MAQHTLSQLFDTYLTDYHSDTKPKTRYAMQVFCRECLRDFGDIPLVDLTTDVIRAWVTTQRQTRKPATIYRKCARLSAILRVAVENYEWLTEHPMRRIRKPSLGRGRVRFLRPEERQALLTACRRSRNPFLYPLVALALFTGGRKDELRTLRWSEVDLTHGTVTFLETKTDKPRKLPLADMAVDILRTLNVQRTDPLCPWVFPSPDGRHPRSFECAWRWARQRAGIQDFRFHDLRHTYASYLAMSGASLRDIAELLGHAKISTTMIYAHLCESHTAPLVQKMAAKFLC